jgi:hypothetical protein
MVGVGLGRLWDTHPKVALVLHLLLTVYLGALAVWLFVTGATGTAVVLAIGFRCDESEPSPVHLSGGSEPLAIGRHFIRR